MPPSWEPRTVRSGSPPAANSSSIAMFTRVWSSVRGRERLGALDGQDGLADRNGTLARLGAEELEAELVVAVALPQLGTATDPRHDGFVAGLGIGGQEGMPSAAQVDGLGG